LIWNTHKKYKGAIRMKKYISLLFFGLFSTSPVFAAFPASIDTDGDGVPNPMEFWLRAHGIAVSETVSDTYTDTDGDGIPDLVEDNISHTDKAVNESTVATAIAGFGLANNSGEVAGQWDVCLHVNDTDVSGDTGTPDECESVYTAISYRGFSIMHSDSDQIKVYTPGSGYAVTASYNSGSNAYNATFSETRDDGVVVTFVVNGTFDGTDRMTGTVDISEDGVPIPQLRATAIRRASGWTGTGDPSGIYTFQDTTIDTDTSLPIQRSVEFTPENFVLELSFSGTEVIFHDEYGTADPFGGLYMPALGAIIEAFSDAETEDLDGDDLLDDVSYEVGKSSIMVLALPAGNNSGLIRGAARDSYYDDIDSNQPLTNGLPTGFLDETVVPGAGDELGSGENHFYGRHHEPRVVTYTRNTTAGFQSHIAVNNVPLAASQITASGPGGFATTDVVNEGGGTSLMDTMAIRNRADPESRPDGFIGLQVGITDNDQHNVSTVHLRSDRTSSVSSLFPSGTYTYFGKLHTTCKCSSTA
jgi:hypothetical protein